MNDKQQIEEIAQDIASNCPDMVDNACGGKPCYVCLAERLVKDNYRKIPENAVMMTREYYNRIRSQTRKVIDLESIIKADERIRKDTAREIIEKVLGFIGSNQKFWLVDDERITINFTDDLFDFMGNLAKQCGVQIEE